MAAKNDLMTNIQQVANDFNSIKQALVNKGAEVPEGTKTSEYAGLINGLEVGGTIIQYGENIFSYTDFKEQIFIELQTGGIGVYNGNVEFDDDNKKFALNATAKNCYTNTITKPKINIISTNIYELSFNVEGNDSYFEIYFNGGKDINSKIYISGNQINKFYLSLVEGDYITFCFGVNTANNQCIFSNILLREVII